MAAPPPPPPSPPPSPPPPSRLDTHGHGHGQGPDAGDGVGPPTTTTAQPPPRLVRRKKHGQPRRRLLAFRSPPPPSLLPTAAEDRTFLSTTTTRGRRLGEGEDDDDDDERKQHEAGMVPLGGGGASSGGGDSLMAGERREVGSTTTTTTTTSRSLLSPEETVTPTAVTVPATVSVAAAAAVVVPTLPPLPSSPPPSSSSPHPVGSSSSSSFPSNRAVLQTFLLVLLGLLLLGTLLGPLPGQIVRALVVVRGRHRGRPGGEGWVGASIGRFTGPPRSQGGRRLRPEEEEQEGLGSGGWGWKGLLVRRRRGGGEATAEGGEEGGGGAAAAGEERSVEKREVKLTASVSDNSLTSQASSLAYEVAGFTTVSLDRASDDSPASSTTTTAAAAAATIRSELPRRPSLSLPSVRSGWGRGWGWGGLPSILLHPLPSFLRLSSSSSSLTLGQAFLVVTYALLVLGFTSVLAPSPAGDPLRSGLIATAQIPLVVALGVKSSSPLSAAGWLGKGPERVNFLHRLVGRLIFAGSTVHAGAYLYKWAKADVSFATKKQQPVFLAAFVAYLALSLVAVASLPVIRRRAYELFAACHWLGFMTFLIALIWHAPVCIPFSLAGLGLYTFDQLYRLLLKRSWVPLEAQLTALADGETTVLELETVQGGWTPGAYVYVRLLPGSGLALGSVLEKVCLAAARKGLLLTAAHPFTIASAPRHASDPLTTPTGGLRLFIKSTGGWTASLYRLALATEADHAVGLRARRTVRVLLDGPYGGPASGAIEAFEAVALVAGGSGVSAALGLAEGLAKARAAGSARARQVDLHWAIHTPVKFEAFLPFLTPLLSSTTVHIYITRSSLFSAAGSAPSTLAPPAHPNLKITFGRPNFAALVDETIDALVRSKAVSRGSPHAAGRPSGLAIAVCGPTGMVNSLREAVGGLGPGQAKSCGGCELFTETFGM